ncbi:hypothetical protein [Streptomyces sp. NPDC001744]|uniref:hypothetical protein n=1 Tax=Streptomyces sp. NPDC001744 TaxID=3364606 RepID=UPI003693CEF0
MLTTGQAVNAGAASASAALVQPAPEKLTKPSQSETVRSEESSAGGQYVPAEARVLDNVTVEPGATLTVQVAGTASLPAVGLDTVAVSVAAKGDRDSGSLVVYPAGEVEPDTASVSYDKAHYAATTLVTKVGNDGQVKVVNQGTASVRVYFDVQGYTLQQPNSQGSTYTALSPQRILAPTNVGAGGNLELKPIGQGGVPAAGVTAVALNVQVRSSSTGTVRVYPAGDSWPVDATIDYQKGVDQQNFTITKIGTNGIVNIHNLGWGSAEVTADVVGYFTSSSNGPLRTNLRSVLPSRIAEKLVIPAGGDKVVDPRGVAGVPVLNTTAVGIGVTAFGEGSGAVHVSPTQTAISATPLVTYAPNAEVTGFTLAKLGGDGKVNLRNTGLKPVTVWVDVLSYAELVERTFPVPTSVGQAIENITGTADVTSEVGSDTENIVINSRTDDSGTTTVEIPRDPRQGIHVRNDAGTTILHLPATGTASRTNGGTVIYDGTSSAYSIGVQPTTDGGFRTFAHLDDATAPTSYDFPMTLPAGTQLAIDELDGSALVVKEHASTTEPTVLLEEVTRIQKPWAKDARGRTWPTSYSVEGNILRLTIDLTPVMDASGTTVAPQFPVVADPWVKRNCGIVTCSWYFSKATTRWMKAQFDNRGWTVATASGVICGNLPHAVAKAACAIAVGYYYNSAFNNTRAAYNRGGCLVVRVNVLWGATPLTAWRTVRFDNVPLSNRYCYAS